MTGDDKMGKLAHITDADIAVVAMSCKADEKDIRRAVANYRWREASEWLLRFRLWVRSIKRGEYIEDILERMPREKVVGDDYIDKLTETLANTILIAAERRKDEEERSRTQREKEKVAGWNSLWNAGLLPKPKNSRAKKRARA